MFRVQWLIPIPELMQHDVATWKQMVFAGKAKGGWKKFRTCCLGLCKEITILNHMGLLKHVFWDENDNLI